MDTFDPFLCGANTWCISRFVSGILPIRPVLGNHPISVLDKILQVFLGLLSIGAGLWAAVEHHAHEAKDNCIQLCWSIAHHEWFRAKQCRQCFHVFNAHLLNFLGSVPRHSLGIDLFVHHSYKPNQTIEVAIWKGSSNTWVVFKDTLVDPGIASKWWEKISDKLASV